MEIDFYEILQVSPRAETEVIEAAYRRLANKYHPDRNKAADASDRMKALNQAYAVLRDPTERARYDRKRQTTSHPAPQPSQRPTPKPATTPRPAPKPTTPPQPPPSPPPDPPPSPARANYSDGQSDVFVSEALVTDSLQMLQDSPVLTSALLQRRLGIGAPRAERLFQVLMERGVIDRKGHRTDANAQQHPGARPAHPPSADDLSALVPEVLKLLQTEKTISVSLLQEKFSIGFARATALYQLLSEQEIVDQAGRPTAAAKELLATQDLGAVFGCPLCEQAFVHHYQIHKRLLPGAHFFKCPNCQSQFEQTKENLYRLAQLPEKYARLGSLYKNRSFTPAQWKVIKKAEGLT